MCLIIKNFMLFKKPTLVVILIIPIFLTSCGGGGGGGGSPAPSAPSATISFSTSFDSEVDVGTDFLFSWSTSNAVSCSASGDWSGTVATSGNHNKVLDAAGSYDFTLTCLNSESNQTSRTLSVEANYVLITGNIFDSDNSNKTVYIDDNFNGVKDEHELSGISDSVGNYKIRHSNDLACIKSFPIRVDSSDLFSINPKKGIGEVNLSPITSLFLTDSSMYINEGFAYQNNTDLCDFQDMSELNYRMGSYYEKSSDYIFNGDQFLYEEIQADPSSSTRSSISYSRFDDIKLFQNSLKNVTNELDSAIKTLLDQSWASDGYSSNDYNISFRSALYPSSFRIFLNDNSYPNPSTDLSPVASSIDAVAVPAYIYFRLDPKSSLPNYDLNGWDEMSSLALKIFINNNNQVVANSYQCWINFNSLCIEDISTNIFNYGANSFNLDYRLWKNTSRGVEQIRWDERYIGVPDSGLAGRCNVFSAYVIYEDTSKLSSFNDTYYDTSVYDEECAYNQSGSGAYQYMIHQKFFEDGSFATFLWDSDAVDSLNLVVNPSEYLESNLPPSTISQEYATALSARPNLYDSSLNIDFEDNGEALFNWFADFMTTKYLNSNDWYYLDYYIDNIKGGYARLNMTNGAGFVQLSCSFNGNDYAYSEWFGTDFDSAIYGLYICLTAVNEAGEFYFSRQSTHHESRDQITISPYTGENIISTSNPNSTNRNIQYKIDKKLSKPNEEYIDKLELYESFVNERRINNYPSKN